MELPIIILGRHGQDEDNAQKPRPVLNGRRDKKLTKLGKEQVRQSTELLIAGDYDIKQVYTSKLKRSRKSGAIIAKRLGLEPPIACEELVERFLGDVQGLTVEEAKKIIHPDDLMHTSHTSYADSHKYNMEGFENTEQRVRPFLERLSHMYTRKETVLVTAHGDVNVALCAVAIDACMRELIYELPYIPNGGLLRIEDGAVYELSELVSV